MGRSADKETLDRLMVDCLPAALRFAVRLTGDSEVAEEIVQEALVRVARGWRSFRGEARFRTWLFRIVINAHHDHLAVRTAMYQLPEAVEDSRATDPQSAAMATDLGRQIAAGIAELPPRQREVLVLSAYEGLTPSETAEVLGITEANVYSTLHVARTRLRKELAAYLAEK